MRKFAVGVLTIGVLLTMGVLRLVDLWQWRAQTVTAAKSRAANLSFIVAEYHRRAVQCRRHVAASARAPQSSHRRTVGARHRLGAEPHVGESGSDRRGIDLGHGPGWHHPAFDPARHHRAVARDRLRVPASQYRPRRRARDRHAVSECHGPHVYLIPIGATARRRARRVRRCHRGDDDAGRAPQLLPHGRRRAARSHLGVSSGWLRPLSRAVGRERDRPVGARQPAVQRRDAPRDDRGRPRGRGRARRSRAAERLSRHRDTAARRGRVARSRRSARRVAARGGRVGGDFHGPGADARRDALGAVPADGREDACGSRARAIAAARSGAPHRRQRTSGGRARSRTARAARSRGGQRAQGSVPDDRVARAAHAADRHLRLGAHARSTAASTSARGANGARRPSSATPARRRGSSTTCSTCRA